MQGCEVLGVCRVYPFISNEYKVPDACLFTNAPWLWDTTYATCASTLTILFFAFVVERHPLTRSGMSVYMRVRIEKV